MYETKFFEQLSKYDGMWLTDEKSLLDRVMKNSLKIQVKISFNLSEH